MNNNAQLQRALAASLANAEAKNASNYAMAQNASRGVAENNLYMDAAMEMHESMFDKPDARRRLIAGTGLDTLMLQFPGDEQIEGLRDHLLETRYDPTSADDDPVFLEAQGMLEAYGVEDSLVTGLQEVHESMLVEEEQRRKEIQNAINRAAAEENERQRREAEEAAAATAAAAEAAKPVIPNRNAARAQRMAFLNRLQKKNNTAKNGGRRRRSTRRSTRRRRCTRRNGKN